MINYELSGYLNTANGIKLLRRLLHMNTYLGEFESVLVISFYTLIYFNPK